MEDGFILSRVPRLNLNRTKSWSVLAKRDRTTCHVLQMHFHTPNVTKLLLKNLPSYYCMK